MTPVDLLKKGPLPKNQLVSLDVGCVGLSSNFMKNYSQLY